MHVNTSNRIKCILPPKKRLRLTACLLGSFLLTIGILQTLDEPGKKMKVAFAENELVVFTEATEFASVDLTSPQWGAVWGDYDGDGDQDLYAGNHFNTPNLYRNNGDGTFTDMREFAGIKSGPSDWHGAAWGDCNNDGHLDLYVVTGRAVVNGSDFYVNNGDGTFTEHAVAAGITNDDGRGRVPRWVDYDKDGDLDIFIANASRPDAPCVLYRNNNDGTFTDVAVQAGVAIDTGTGGMAGVTWADYDNDGHTDFVLTPGGGVKLYRNQGDGTFVETTSSAGIQYHWGANSGTWGDYDNDGDMDLYIGRSYSSYQDKLVWDTKAITATAHIYGGEEGLIFTTTTPAVNFDLWRSDRRHYSYEIEFGSDNEHPPTVPFTLDNTTNHMGQPDYTPGAEDRRVFIWRDSTTGPWNIRWSSSRGFDVVGVITTEGDFTEVVPVGFDSPSSPPRPNVLYRNNGDGTFEEIDFVADIDDQSSTYSVQWVDFDNDGDLDLYLTNFGDTYIGNQPNRLYQNNKDGTFTDVTTAVGLPDLNSGNDTCSAWADYDNDGFLDMFLSNSTYNGYLAGPHKLYRNGGNSNHWLQIGLTGTTSNRLGIGAKIQVTIGGLTQFREVGVNSSGGCHNSLLAHFGLGEYAQADVITVTWPSGYVQVLHDVPADQILHITEGLESDLAITKARTGVGDVIAGEPITYIFTMTNAGPTTPVTATVVDAFSDAAALDGVSGSGCAWPPGSAVVNCTVTDITSDTASHLTLIVTTSHTYSGTLSNTAMVAPTGGIIDPNASNNSAAQVTVTVMGGEGGEHTIYMPIIFKATGQ
jgi:hypothetical protein